MTQRSSTKLLIKQALLLGLLYSTSAWSLASDKKEVISFSADTVNIEYQKKVTNLTGNAVITQGSTTIVGENIFIYQKDDNQVDKIVIYGSEQQQAKYTTQIEKKDSLFAASADIIEYYEDKKLAVFSGNVHTNDGVNFLDGPKISYWMDKKRLISDASKTQRTTIRITPNAH
jgi:lipopolysaccharide transport protein LptA